MTNIIKAIGALAATVAIVAGLIFGAGWAKLGYMRYFGTAIESTKTDIYRENKSYVEGTVRDLRELQVDYVKAGESQKETLASLILHRANELDWDRLPSDVRAFLNNLKAKQ